MRFSFSLGGGGCTPSGARFQVVFGGGLVDNLGGFCVPAEGYFVCHSRDIRNPISIVIFATVAEDFNNQKLLFCARLL